MLQISTFFVLFGTACALLEVNYTQTKLRGADAFGIVANYDRDRALEYISRYELVVQVSEHVFQKFEELRWSTEEEKNQLYREFKLFADASPDDQKETIFGPEGKPSMFPVLSKKIAHLNRITRRELANAKKDPDVPEEITKDPKTYFEYIIYWEPVYALLEAAMEDYEERGLTKDQIREEIKLEDDFHIAIFNNDHEAAALLIPKFNEKERNRLGLIYEYLKNTPKDQQDNVEMKRLVHEKIKWGVKSTVNVEDVKSAIDRREELDKLEPQAVPAWNIVFNFDFDTAFEYTTVIETAVYIVGKLFEKVPQVKLPPEGQFQLSREVAFFITAPIEVQKAAIFDNIFPSKFKTIEKTLNHLREIAKIEFPKGPAIEKRSHKNEEGWVKFKAYYLPFHELMMAKMINYEKWGYTKEDIKKDITDSAIELFHVIFKDEASRAQIIKAIEEKFPKRDAMVEMLNNLVSEDKEEVEAQSGFKLFNENENEYEL